MEKDDNKQIKASSWALGILFIVSAAVLVLFYGFGYDNTEYLNNKNLTAPLHTGTLIIWMYALVAICIGAVLLFGIVNGFKNMKYRSIERKKPVNEDVRKEGRVSYAAPIFLVTILIIVAAYFLSDDSPLRLGDQKLYEVGSMLKLSDVCLYSIYALTLGAILCSLLSMIGLFRKK
ncbi:MAG: hypothetical protein IK006_07945 [Bacteroidaceae bacterium]|nr:hypothetical protein [Bacteroidaceae bacterium]